jgi:hypothetical protein
MEKYTIFMDRETLYYIPAHFSGGRNCQVDFKIYIEMQMTQNNQNNFEKSEYKQDVHYLTLGLTKKP